MSGSHRPSPSAGLIDRLRHRLGRRAPEHNFRDSIAELVQEAADAPETPGELPDLDRQERALIANVLRLRGMTADDVMVPRADIVAMSVETSLPDALTLIRDDGHSRLPVYREQLDDIVGMVHIKDVFASVGSDRRRSSWNPSCAARCWWRHKFRCWTCCCKCARRGCIWRWWWTNMAASTGW